MSSQSSSGRSLTEPVESDPPASQSRRQFLGRTGAGALAIGLGAAGTEQLLAAPRAEAAAFGFSSSGGFFTVNTGAGLSFMVSQSNGDMTSLVYNGTELTAASRPSNVESGLSFMDSFGFAGTVSASGRGSVTGTASGVTSGMTMLVGWANSTAQYWTAPASNGSFTSPAMKPGTYTQTLYQNELAVATSSVTVSAASTTSGQDIASAWTTPASPLFRIGSWTGSPEGLLNWPNLTSMHPSDARMASWGPVTFTVGSRLDSQFPAYQFKLVNNPTTIQFTLSASQIGDCTVRIGITAAYAGGRPQITVNSWTSAIPSPSSQPDSRSLTIGTYRGNNTLFTYTVPASALVAGTNTMQITVVSGSSALSDWLSPAFSYDCVEMYGGQPSGNIVTVASPGNQSGTVGTPTSSVQIRATDSASGQTLTYSATGLPPGLSISSSGLISGTPSTSGNYSVTVTARDSTGASGSAAFTWAVSGPATGGTVNVAYDKASEWQGGFTANVTITNNGSAAINGWTAAWTFPGDQQITSAWNATVTQSGAAVSATNMSYNATIAPGGSTSFGMQGTWTSNDSSPATFTLNGTPVS